jgi:hypothetical protein
MTLYRFKYLCVALFLIVQGTLWAQYDPLPRTYRDMYLGMSIENLQEALINDNLFHYRGERDVSFLPASNQNVIETTGFSFIRRAFFQLREGQLFTMAFVLNTTLIDYYSVFTTFVNRYGDPTSLDPRQAVWENGETRISIERPLTVRYIDMAVFNQLTTESRVTEARETRLREEFLNDF